MSRISEIEGFIEVVDAGSFSAAAKRLRLTKSTLSRRVTNLEARLGVQLLNRTTRTLALTEAGQILYRRCSGLLSDLEDAEDEATARQSELRGTLKVAAPRSFGELHMRDLIGEFLSAHPDLVLEIEFDDRVMDIVSEGYDMAIRIGRLPDSSLIARKVCPVNSIAIAAPCFWDRHGRPTRVEDLAGLPSLRYANHPLLSVIQYKDPEGKTGRLTTSPRLVTNDGLVLAEAATTGVGFAIEPIFIVDRLIKSGRLEPVLQDYTWLDAHLHVVYPPTRQVSARVRAFADFIVDRFSDGF